MITVLEGFCIFLRKYIVLHLKIIKKKQYLCHRAYEKAVLTTGLNLENCIAMQLMNLLFLWLIFGRLSGL